MKTRVVVVGSSNTDLVLQCSRLPGPGETVVGGELERFQGGKGANQAVAAARAGAQVTFVGAHGGDDFGRRARKELQKEGIDVRHFRRKEDVPSGVALIFLGGRARQNQIGVARSANDRLSVKDVERARSAFRETGVVIAQLEVPLGAVETAALLAVESDVPFVLNPGPAPSRRLPARLLRRIHTITPNEQEATALTGERSPRKAARVLRAKGCDNVVVTLGSRGALVLAGDGKPELLPARRVRPVDTVGAGDCFTAWLAVGIAEGLPVVKAARRAIRASAIAVTRAGAQAGMPHRREVVRGKGRGD